ncbi:hypothetical protein JCM11641_001228 [Rhodosporidiobolus odoratus]
MAASAAPPAKPAHQTDFRRRAVLPSTLSSLRANPSASAAGAEVTSEEYLDRIEEELNRRVDGDVEQLVEGMRELVGLARVDPLHPPHPSTSAHRALATKLRTEQMLKSAHSLLNLAHTLKLLHLFGDQAAGRQVKESREKELVEEIEGLKRRAAELASASGQRMREAMS